MKYILFCIRWLWKNRTWTGTRQKYKAMDRDWNRKQTRRMTYYIYGAGRMRRKAPMPGYYRKNIVKNAQRKFLQRKKREREAKQTARAQEMTETKEEK